MELTALFSFFRNFKHRYNRLWRRLYYFVTDALIIILFSAVFVGIWAYFFVSR